MRALAFGLLCFLSISTPAWAEICLPASQHTDYAYFRFLSRENKWLIDNVANRNYGSCVIIRLGGQNQVFMTIEPNGDARLSSQEELGYFRHYVELGKGMVIIPIRN